MNFIRTLPFCIVAAGLLHCGDSGGTGGGAGTTVSGSTVTGQAIPDFNACTNAAYEDRSAPNAMRTIVFGKTGTIYDPRCMIVAAGQEVTFDGQFSLHPLAPGNLGDAAAGTAGNPIVETGSGTTAKVTFTKPGTYPYHCTFHSQATGSGMAGVVHVR